MEPFIQETSRAYLHRANHFNGVPQRLGDVQADVRGYVSELLSKAINVGGLECGQTCPISRLIAIIRPCFSLLVVWAR